LPGRGVEKRLRESLKIGGDTKKIKKTRTPVGQVGRLEKEGAKNCWWGGKKKLWTGQRAYGVEEAGTELEKQRDERGNRPNRNLDN